MKKFLVPAMIVLATAATASVHAATPSDNLSRHALGEAKDTRSAWAKSQDMYVEPTLRVTETTVPVTPEQAQQQNLPVQAAPAGTVPATGSSTTTTIGPDGQPVSEQAMPGQPMPDSAQPAAAPGEPVPMQQGNDGTPVQDLSRPQP
ncbi:hypothetical protein CAP48_11905 [Advenella sp. S44]|uniref:hypothetical protein n=1 Tax=Advenella sp. S44 TaxID=1982755 RepID=UPI000CB52F42|nr:hypothetical protein [Advenella sp. S44]PJX23779.1 hypothetical protein CAP48_11905 [Advenella sp. S44]